MNDGSSLPPELDACHRLIEQLSAEREQLTSRLQSQEAFVEEQSRTVIDLADSRQQLSQENEELKLAPKWNACCPRAIWPRPSAI